MICLALYNSQNGYNQQQLERMQREAINRVNEMQRRSQRMVNPSSPQQRQQPPRQEEASRNSTPPPVMPPPTEPKHENSGFSQALGDFSKGGILEGLSGLWNFNIDEEKALIGIIIYILIKNKADPKLILGLGYLLL